ncbi:MAG TPA: glycosyltransferase family 2 protein [Steroidobacteraceae bacterium]|nr:glycosyltransferase family 2 protein [Steroidobacteraceae bacterium]
MPLLPPILWPSALWLAVVAWLISRAVRQRNVLAAVPVSTRDPGGTAPRVAVIVPARDEAANIGPCIRSLCAQQYPPDRLRIIVVDDDSSDGTGAIVAGLARQDERITLLRTPPLPPGWKGKVHACCTAAAAAPPDAQWLCFLDADMRAAPRAIASAVEAACGRGLDLLTLAPRHELGSFAERLMLPCGLYLLGFYQDLERIQAPDSGEVVATGQFMLLRRAAYDAVGGHAPVRGAICEDVELALLMKRRGYRVLLMDGNRLLSTRMYTGWSTLWPGFAKNLTQLLGGPLRTLLAAPVVVALAWTAVWLPLFDLAAVAHGVSGAIPALALASLGCAAMIGLHLGGAVHFRIPWWYGLLFPLGYTAGAVMALDSVRWRFRRRVHWKGRVYTS